MSDNPDFARERSLRRRIQKIGEALTPELGEVEWLDPWQPAAPGLERELAREVGRGHALAGRRAVAVARRIDNDDVLFYLPDGPTPLAVVHLTWTGRRERKPEWPYTVLYHSVADFVERRMRPEAWPRPDHRGDEC
jgi:hypothetical protein